MSITGIKEELQREGLALRKRGIHNAADHYANLYLQVEQVEKELARANSRAASAEAIAAKYRPTTYGRRPQPISDMMLGVTLSIMANGNILSKPECCQAILDTNYLQDRQHLDQRIPALITEMKKVAKRATSPP